MRSSSSLNRVTQAHWTRVDNNRKFTYKAIKIPRTGRGEGELVRGNEGQASGRDVLSNDYILYTSTVPFTIP